jgi:hypothetical protein
MNKPRKLFIRIRMEDGMGNSDTLDVTNDAFNVLHYNLYSTMGTQPLSLSNLGSALPLPDTKNVTVEKTASQVQMQLGQVRRNVELIFAREC